MLSASLDLFALAAVRGGTPLLFFQRFVSHGFEAKVCAKRTISATR